MNWYAEVCGRNAKVHSFATYDSITAYLHCISSTVQGLLVCCPHYTDMTIQLVKLETKQNPFSVY